MVFQLFPCTIQLFLCNKNSSNIIVHFLDILNSNNINNDFIKNGKDIIVFNKPLTEIKREIKNKCKKINIDIKSNQFKDQIIEVQTTLALQPIDNNIEKIDTKIVFSTIIEIEGQLTDKKSLEEVILIKVPNEVYPEIRGLFVSLFERSGYKKIKIEETIDFRELYQKRTIQ